MAQNVPYTRHTDRNYSALCAELRDLEQGMIWRQDVAPHIRDKSCPRFEPANLLT